MEIKKGDKVRVSKDAPRMYVRGWSYILENSDCKVDGVEDDNAVITNGPHIIAIPTKYLIKVDAEEKELKFKVGDKVIFIPTGKVKVVSRINANSQYAITEPNGLSPLCVRETELAPYIEPTSTTIKVGDRVEELVSRKSGRVLGIDGDFVVVGIPYDKEKHYWHIDSVELVQPKEQTEAAKSKDGISEETANEISNILEVYTKTLSGIADPFDWDAYTADLAKEIVLKTVNTASDKRPEKVAEYAVQVAKAVVAGLKRK